MANKIARTDDSVEVRNMSVGPTLKITPNGRVGPNVQLPSSLAQSAINIACCHVSGMILC